MVCQENSLHNARILNNTYQTIDTEVSRHSGKDHAKDKDKMC